MKKIFTIKNKFKLQELFTSMILKAIEVKKENLEKEGCNFKVVEEIRRTQKWISPYSCVKYLQCCTLSIPIATYDIRMLIYNHLGIDVNKDFLYSDSDDQTIDQEYWNLMGVTLYRIANTKIK